MATTKLHHYRPQHHLANFCDAEGKLLVYGTGGRRFETTPKTIGAETHLYRTLAVGSAPANDDAETWLANVVDGPAKEAMDLLASGSSLLSAKHSEALVLYMVAQDMRTPLVMEKLVAHLASKDAENSAIAMNATIAEFEAAHGAIPNDVRTELLQYRHESTKNDWLKMMRKRAQPVADHLTRVCHFFRVNAPSGADWITNDIGVVKFDRGFDDPIDYRSGIHSLLWLMPISSRTAFAMAPNTFRARTTFTPAMTRNANRQLARDAVRHAYSRGHADWIHSWMQPTSDSEASE